MVEYQNKLTERDLEIKRLERDIERLKSDLRAAQTSLPSILSGSQQKNKYVEENIVLKQTLTGLSAELSTIKNEKLNL